MSAVTPSELVNKGHRSFFLSRDHLNEKRKDLHQISVLDLTEIQTENKSHKEQVKKFGNSISISTSGLGQQNFSQNFENARNSKLAFLADDFWYKRNTWQKREKIAENFLVEWGTGSDDVHWLAFNCKLNALKSIHNENKRMALQGETLHSSARNSEKSSIVQIEIKYQILKKNALNLSPLIYAIWGENKINDTQRLTSTYIFKLSEKRRKEALSKSYQNQNIPLDLDLKHELGHAFVHGVIPKTEDFIYNLVVEDFHESLAYYYEQTSFKLTKQEFDHSLVKKGEKISTVALAVRINANKCAKHLFEQILKNINNPDCGETFNIVEAEFIEYLTFNSPLVEKFIRRLVEVEWKFLKIYPEDLPLSNMFESKKENEDIHDNFDKKQWARSVIKCKFLRFQIRLPSIPGSKRSLKFLGKLCASQNMNLFKTDMVKVYISHKWKSLRVFIFVQSFLMWINIPLIVLLIMTPNDVALLFFFILINLIQGIFELLQYISLGLGRYFGEKDIWHLGFGLRFLLLPLMFFPNVEPFITVVYTLITSKFVYERGMEKTNRRSGMLKKVAVLFIYLLFIFPPFWSGWRDVWALVIVYWSVFGFCWLFLSEENQISASRFLRMIEFGMLIVMMASSQVGLGIMVFTQFILGLVFFSEIKLYWLKERNARIFFDFLKMVVFSVNFYSGGAGAYYSVNLITLLLGICTFQWFIFKRRPEDSNFDYDSFVFLYSFTTMNMIAFDLNDDMALKFTIIALDFLFIMYLNYVRMVSLKKIIFCLYNLCFNWNTIDLTRIILCIIWLVGIFLSNSSLAVTYVLVVLILIRGLTGFRCYQATRYYVRLILHSTKDIIPFLIIFFYSTLSFGIICSIYQSISPSQLWMYSYDLNISIINHGSTFDMNYISFFITTVINVIIMLNLLISILGNSFDKFQLNAAEIDYLEMAETLSEVETMLVWNLNKDDNGLYLINVSNETGVNKNLGKVNRNDFLGLKEDVIAIKDFMDKELVGISENISEIKNRINGENDQLS